MRFVKHINFMEETYKNKLNQLVKCHKQLAKAFDDSSRSKAISVNTDSWDLIILLALSELRARFLRVNADKRRILFEMGPSSTDLKF